MTDIQACGHPASAIESADEGTQHCAACEEEARNAPLCDGCGKLLVARHGGNCRWFAHPDGSRACNAPVTEEQALAAVEFGGDRGKGVE